MGTLQSIPAAPGALPLFGHLTRMLRDPFGLFADLHKYGDLVRIFFGPSEIVVVCAAELTREVLLHDRTFDKAGPLFELGCELFGQNLATCPHDLHRVRRRRAQPAFHRDRLVGYADTMTSHIDNFTRSWRNDQIVDVWSATRKLTAAVIADTIFGASLPAHHLERMVNALTTIIDGSVTQTVMPAAWRRLPLPANRHYRAAKAQVRRIVHDITADRHPGDGDQGSLISALVAAEISTADLANEIAMLFVAGYETTASTLAWALHLLAKHPDVEHRLHAEVQMVLGGAPAGYDHLTDLDLTARVITESLRLHPPAWVITRKVTSDTELGGHNLSAGTTLLYSPHIIHHRSDLYHQPDRFDVDRWLPGHASNLPRGAYIPFGHGARRCIGEHFATMEATLALATIIARWELRPIPGTVVRPALAASTHPKGLLMKAVARHPTKSGLL
ncbi:cytochrome P450 [Nocardia sp. CA-107356]|uniref:cytochrome P450 n=1 Tax=Nocardia sp. CA-107356 TaxID=3239972 RepID=UPI003D8F11FC